MSESGVGRIPTDPGAWVEAAIRLVRRPGTVLDRQHAERVISLLEPSYTLLPPRDPRRLEAQMYLLTSLFFVFDQDGDESVLERIEQLLADCGAHYPVDGPGRGNYLLNASFASLRRAEITDALEPVLGAVRHARLGVEEYPRHPALLSVYGSALAQQFDRTGDVRVLRRCIEMHQRAIKCTPEGDPDHAARLSELGTALARKARASNRLDDVREAVSAQRRAVGESGIDDMEARARDIGTGMQLYNLGCVLLHEYELTRAPTVLAEAIARHRQAMTAPAMTLSKAAMFSEGLANALLTRFEDYGDEAALGEVIRVRRATIADLVVLPERHPVLTRSRSNLAGTLMRRYERIEESEGLQEAEELIRDVLEVTEDSDPVLPIRLNTLGIILGRSGQSTPDDDVADAVLDQACVQLRRALNLAPDHALAPMFRSNLAAFLLSRFERTAESAPGIAEAYLNEAIGLHRQAVSETPPEHYEHSRYVGNLALAVAAKARFAQDIEVLKEAQEACEAVLEALPEHDPRRAATLTAAGHIQQCRYELTGNVAAARAAREHYLGVAGDPTAPAAERIRSAVGAATLCARLEDHRQGLEVLEDAVMLLERALSPALSNRDQERLLAELTAMPRDAAAMAIAVGELERALTVLELGRGVLLNRMSAARTEYDQLAEQSPELAETLRAMQAELDRSQDPEPPPADERTTRPAAPPVAPAADRRAELARRFGELIEEIRLRPGLEDFLRPRLPDRLLDAATDGPVAIVNISDLRCDALLLTRDGLVHVPLPQVTAAEVSEQANAFITACGTQAGSASTEVVEWTWKSIARPILEAAGITGPPEAGHEPPRMWWCPTGMAAFLPLHAAGLHDSRRPELSRSVVDYTVPSCTASVQTLHRLRAGNPDTQCGSQVRMLVVGVAAPPQFPAAPPLQAVERDLRVIRENFAEPTVLESTAACRAEVIDAMAQHDHVHFACHGQQNLASPFEGLLHLHDGPLTTREIARLRLVDARFAYLSACETYLAGTTMPDEAITPAAALHLVGYRHVIATQWQVNDDVAAQVAEAFYKLSAVRDAEDRVIALREIPEALRRAMLDVRAGGAPPLYWAPFIHTGP